MCLLNASRRLRQPVNSCWRPCIESKPWHRNVALQIARRSALLLAGHRMPSYRARMLGLAGSLTQTRGTTGADVVLCDTLAPQLSGVFASAMHPPLPPLQPAGKATAAAGWSRLQNGGGTGAWRWLPIGGGSSTAGAVRLQISLEAPESGAALRSITSARLRHPGRASLPTRWAVHVGPPPVQPGDEAAAHTADDHPNAMRLWLSNVIQSVRPQQQQQQSAADQRSILEVELPIAQARQLLSQPQLSLKLRSDFAEAAVAVQLRRRLLWALGDSAEAVAQLLALSEGSAAQSATSSNVPEPADSAAAPGSAWRRSQAWLGTVWAGDAAQDRIGVLPVGLQFAHFSGAGASLEQQCAALLQLLARLPSSANSNISERHGTAGLALRQRLMDAVRAAWLPRAARRMLHAQQLPDLLMCVVTQQASDLDAIGGACAAAAAAGIEVVLASAPAQADAVTSIVERRGSNKGPPMVLRLQPRDGGRAEHSDANRVLAELYDMMLRVDARRHAQTQTSKL